MKLKRRLKFKNDIPVYVWLGNRGRPANCEIVEYTDNSKIFVQTGIEYYYAIQRIHTASMAFEQKDADKFVFGLMQYLDDEDEDNFFLMLMDFKEWHKVLELEPKK